MINIYTYETILGYITLYEEFGLLTKLCFGKFEHSSHQETYNETPILKQAHCELDEYFRKKRTSFDVKFNLKGTHFQKSVWNELLKIPYGQTRSYYDIARNIENPFAYRAVGLANNKNPLPIFIPCHRVISKNGNLTGYRDGLKLKEFLLNLEK